MRCQDKKDGMKQHHKATLTSIKPPCLQIQGGLIVLIYNSVYCKTTP